MSKSSNYNSDHGPNSPPQSLDPNPPTVAAFSPSNTSGYSASAKQRSTIVVHRKSPLLVATPPQVTRALAHSHPFLLPLNKLLGLITWTTQDPWESFLMIAGFWGMTLYGGEVLRFGGPLILVTFLILGMYSRRYSPLSSTSRTGEKHDAKGHKREPSESSLQHKSLDEIVETMQELTGRCNILLGPFLNMTDFLSTQRTPTSATTRPALTTLFIRILLITPLWILLTCRPIHVLTSRRIVLALGTIVLSWHSRPARITRVILWRSVFLRRTAAFITGLDFPTPGHDRSTISRRKSQANFASEIATKSRSPGVRFTFILYENQRRWIGLGWTTSLFAGERSPWTDDHLNPAPSKDEFELPEVEGGIARWRWLKGSAWHIDGGDVKQHKRSGSRTGSTGTVSSIKDSQSSEADGGGWIYYDNKWEGGRNEDGWGRYTRRRKWYRDAELVEVTMSTEVSPAPTSTHSEDESEKIRRAQAFAKSLNANHQRSQSQDAMTSSTATLRPSTPPGTGNQLGSAFSPQSSREEDDTTSTTDARKKRAGWFSKRSRSDSKSSSGKNTAWTTASERSNMSKDDDVYDKWRDAGTGTQSRMSIGEDVVVGLG